MVRHKNNTIIDNDTRQRIESHISKISHLSEQYETITMYRYEEFDMEDGKLKTIQDYIRIAEMALEPLEEDGHPYCDEIVLGNKAAIKEYNQIKYFIKKWKKEQV